MYLTETIETEYDGMTLKRYLQERHRFSTHLIRRMKFREQGLRVNENHVTVRYVLHAGDVLTMRLSDVETDDPTAESIWFLPPDGMPELHILKEDEHLIFVDKPGGIVCHPSNGHYADTLANQIAEHLGIHQGAIYPMGRLDRDTSGIVCFAKHEDAAGMMAMLRKSGQYEKYYLAEVDGRIGVDDRMEKADRFEADDRIENSDRFEADGSIVDPIGILQEHPLRMGVLSIEEGGKEAETYYKVLSYDEERNTTYICVRIHHGRTHQIRVHMASIGHPIVGDPIYGLPSGAEIGMQGDQKNGVVDMHLHAYFAWYLEPFTLMPSSVHTELPTWIEHQIPADVIPDLIAWKTK